MPNEVRRYDLDDRLLEYSASVVRLVENMTGTKAANHVGGQLLRSGTSPYFNHGEAEAAESPRDFVHKMGVCLKELRETKRALKLTRKVPLVQDRTTIDPLLLETEELIKIFFVSIRTAKKNVVRESPPEPYGKVL
ncbi:MAG: four helix bundle protein [Verrucomicrobia bacterium]|nr:four helix bundle protein [Verrucomicrobiota bacterium]MBT7066038.1 four helix bundle protein [Verrucomicrobiota bacterium]MBT7702457.1 four helix bundle protein [Verrucomicrobiota bacterium]